RFALVRCHAGADGGGQFQFPASIDVLEDPELRDLFETFWTAGEFAAADRMNLFKLAWDLIGSDHASRATSYEKFFVGPACATIISSTLRGMSCTPRSKASWTPMAPARAPPTRNLCVGNEEIDVHQQCHRRIS